MCECKRKGGGAKKLAITFSVYTPFPVSEILLLSNWIFFSLLNLKRYLISRTKLHQKNPNFILFIYLFIGLNITTL